MPYQVANNIDPNKVFLVNFSELEERWDPSYILYSKNTKNYVFPIVPLNDLITKNPQYGTAESGIIRTAEIEPRYIRITDIDEYGNLIEGLGATAATVEKQYILHDNDILFARSGATVGKAYLHKKQPYVCFFAGYMIRIVVDETQILPEYLFIYTQLQPYKDWVKAIQRAAAQPNINAEEFKSMPIPLPPLPIQQQIVGVYNSAQKLRRRKLCNSKQKLTSIDAYLLNELGITMPETDNGLEKRIFTVKFSEVCGGRFDPFYNNIVYSQIEDNTRNGRYKCVKLKKLCTFTSGVVYSSKDETNEGHAILRANNINLETNDLNLSDIRYIDSRIPLPESLKLKKDDIFICTASGSKEHAGKVAFIDTDTSFYFGGFMGALRTSDEDIMPRYLFEYLASIMFKETLYRNLGGTNINNISFKMIENISIPIPPLDKQREIAEHIAAIRAEAKRLEQEGEEILQSARQQVERMILGIPNQTNS
jgi:restriction endonuclease S subunit